MTPLWPHQSRGIDALRAEFIAGRKRVVGIAPTGSGKSRLAVYMCDSAKSMGNNSLWITHTKELADQAVNEFNQQGIEVGVLQGSRKHSKEHPIQIATIQTLIRRDPPPAGLIVLDEAHLHIQTKSTNIILSRYPDAAIVGLTASPTRLDGRTLKAVYESMVTIALPSELLALGILVPSRVFAPSEPDLARIRTVDGDYKRSDLAVACNKPRLIGDIVDTYRKLGNNRQAILFAVDIAHSQACRDRLIAAGYNASHVDGSMPAALRDERIAAFKRGEIQILCNVEILTTGFDYRELSCVILARPTKSLALYLQMTGRGSRRADGKIDFIVLDHSGNALVHGLPLEDRDWVLEEVGAPSKTVLQPLKTCLSCFAVLPSHMSKCPECGRVFVSTPDPVKAIDGELKEIKYSNLDKKKFFEKMCVDAIAVKQSREYVKNQFRFKFGHYPRGVSWPAELPLDMRWEREKLMRVADKNGYDGKWVEEQMRRIG